MSDNYEAKARLILDGKADLLDDGKIVMIAAKRFNEDFWTAYSKQIAKPVKEPEKLRHVSLSLLKIAGFCPECKDFVCGFRGTMSYCTHCGQKIMFTEDYDDD